MVSRSDSPLSTLDPAAFRLTTSAESRLAASSNDELVRVDDSKKTVITVRPRSVGHLLQVAVHDRLEALGGGQDALDVVAVEVGHRDQVAAACGCSGERAPQCSYSGWMSTTRSSSSTSISSTLTRSARAVGRFLPT